jgi:hypothetical protein
MNGNALLVLEAKQERMFNDGRRHIDAALH